MLSRLLAIQPVAVVAISIGIIVDPLVDFLAIQPVAFISISTGIKVDPLTRFFAIQPVAVVSIFTGIIAGPLARIFVIHKTATETDCITSLLYSTPFVAQMVPFKAGLFCNSSQLEMGPKAFRSTIKKSALCKKVIMT